MARVTMKDIAGVVGVSTMTVSNAFNRPDQLSAELRQRILDRAAKMGYAAPSATARSLRSGRTNSFGVVFSESLSYAFSDPFSVAWLGGLSEPLERAGATIVLLPVPFDEAANVELVLRAAVDGIAGLCATTPALVAARQAGLPVVCTDTLESNDAWVAIDDYRAGWDVGTHLRLLGHADVAIVVEHQLAGDRTPGEQELATFWASFDTVAHLGLFDSWSRVRGLVDALGDGTRLHVVTGGWNGRASGHRAAAIALDRRDRPTALACLSDVMAFGVLDALAERGLTPGRDITVTGFDDLPESGRRGLTTIHQPIHEKGRLVGELLLDPHRTPRQVMLPHHLVVRASSGPV